MPIKCDEIREVSQQIVRSAFPRGGISDVWRRFGNNFAVEFEHEPQHAMRGRMRRPHVQYHLLADVVIGVVQLRVRRNEPRHRIG